MAVGKTQVDIKVVLLGKEYAGKTALFERFLNNHFIGNFPYHGTIGASYGGKRMISDSNEVLVLGIWDTAGSERYKSMSRLYYRDAKAAVICYDVTEDASFEQAKYWVDELLLVEPNCRIYLAACKCDLLAPDHFLLHDAVDFAELICARHFTTSSLTGENICAIFQAITNDVVHARKRQTPPNGHSAIQIEATNKLPQQKCC